MAGSRLVVLSGPNKGKLVPIDGVLTIGRGSDNALNLDDLQVSRSHAQVEAKGNGFVLRDLDSGNGTYVGARRVLEYQLKHGDVVQIGQQELRFEQEGAATRAETGVRFAKEPDSLYEGAKAATMYETFFESASQEKDETKLDALQRRLKAVYAANKIIASEHDQLKLFERVLEEVFKLVPAHNGVILLKDKVTSELITEYVKSGDKNEEVTISSSIVNRAFEHGEAVMTVDAKGDSRFGQGASIIIQNIASAMCVPLLHQDETLGVIYVDTRGTTNAFVSNDLELLVAVAAPAAIAIKNAQYVNAIQRAYEDTLIVLANAIELRDHYTVGHTWRVTNFSMVIARELQWSDDKLKEVQMGGVLHDVGKIAVDDSILQKPGKLTEEEYAKMQVHPERGARLLQDVEFLQSLIPYCLYHHERYDGRGYPYGLKGESIPIEGRVVAVADTFDALTSNRPYRKGLDPEVAIAEIEKGKGTQFDPDCADALIRAYRAGKIDQILQDYYKDEKSIACPFCSTHIRIPDGAEIGHEFGCQVCHRQVELDMKNDAWFGTLLPQSAGRLTPIERVAE